MQVNWMGRYRGIVKALVQHGNCCIRAANYKLNMVDGITLTAQEWQVLEYILEHEDDDQNMAKLSERLCIPQSSFSKMSSRLVQYGFLEKYQILGNKKCIILKTSEKGKTFYIKNSKSIKEYVFDDFFHELNGFTDEQLAQFAKAINVIDSKMPGSKDRQQLIKVEE